MATIIHNPYTTLSGPASSTISCTGNSNLYYTNGGISTGWKDESTDIKEFVEFAFQMMGIDMDFEKFKHMTYAEKKAMIREQKINKIIE